VRDPDAEVEALCKKIGVDFEPEMLNYAGGQKFTDTTFVDTKSAYRHDTAVMDYVDAWKSSLDCREKTDLARVYIEALGPETLRAYGEEPDQLLAELDALDSNMQKRTSGINRAELEQVLHHGEATLRRRTRLLSNWRFGGDEKSMAVKLMKSMSILLDGRDRWKTQ